MNSKSSGNKITDSWCNLFAVIEVNVIDVRQKIDDVVFPTPDLADDIRKSNSECLMNGDSIRLSGDTIRELGVDGIHLFCKLQP